MMSNKSQETEAKVFIKSHSPGTTQEWERVSNLYETSLKTCCFNSPKPVHKDSHKGNIHYEYLPEGMQLNRFINRELSHEVPENILLALRRTGESLAFIHENMSPLNEDSVSIDLSILSSVPETLLKDIQLEINNSKQVTFHGDFGSGNIWVEDTSERLFIFDPVPQWHFPNQQAGKTSIYFDIGQMVFALYNFHTIKTMRFATLKNLNQMTEAFISGYEKHADITLSHRCIFIFSLYIMQISLPRSKKVPFYQIKNKIYERFIKRNRTFFLDEITK